jgi:TonB family protein
MNAMLKWARLALSLVLILGCSTILAERALTQDNSGDAARKIRTKIAPEYPTAARYLKLQGKVRIEATVSADGHVTNTSVIGGHPLLASAAVDAVKRWRFAPAPKETTEIIDIVFTGSN